MEVIGNIFAEKLMSNTVLVETVWGQRWLIFQQRRCCSYLISGGGGRGGVIGEDYDGGEDIVGGDNIGFGNIWQGVLAKIEEYQYASWFFSAADGNSDGDKILIVDLWNEET